MELEKIDKNTIIIIITPDIRQIGKGKRTKNRIVVKNIYVITD